MILLRIIVVVVVVEVAHILLECWAAVASMPSISTFFTSQAGIMDVHECILLTGSFIQTLHR
jgi:hypothetical protein